MSTNSEFNECIHFLIGHSHSNFQHLHWVHDFPASKAHLRSGKTVKQKTGSIQQGFTLVELLIVVVIVGILSAVALPQFFSQTKKAAATEGTQQASSIAKQAAAYYLENGAIASGNSHSDCSAYAGTIKTDNTNFTYKCEGSKTAFKVITTGKIDNDNTKDVVVTFTGNLTDGTFSKPVVTGI